MYTNTQKFEDTVILNIDLLVADILHQIHWSKCLAITNNTFNSVFNYIVENVQQA